MYTSALVDALELAGCSRVDRVKDVKPGDVIFNLDANGNGAPDHVVIAVSEPDANARARVIDNQKKGEPYLRNLRKGGYTPMWFALRLPTEYKRVPNTAQYAALQEIKHGLRRVYAQKWVIPEDAQRLLNQFANHAFVKDVEID
jgi:hypothetical protein